jgi:hypothetical protein
LHPRTEPAAPRAHQHQWTQKSRQSRGESERDSLAAQRERAESAGRERTEILFAEKRDVTYSPLTVHIHDRL